MATHALREYVYETNIKSNDRIIKLKVKEGMKPADSSGTIDHRLWKGENAIHVIRQETGLWTLRIEHGSLPPSLASTQYTSFSLAKRAISEYFNKRNLEIYEIIE